MIFTDVIPSANQERANEIRIVRKNLWHDGVIKWKHFPRYCPFVRGFHRSPVNFPHKGQWCGALMFSLICVWINGWVNNREAGDLRRYRTHYDVIVMETCVEVTKVTFSVTTLKACVACVVTSYVDRGLGQISLGDGLVGTKPSPEPTLVYHQWCSIILTWGQFHKKCS